MLLCKLLLFCAIDADPVQHPADGPTLRYRISNGLVFRDIIIQNGHLLTDQWGRGDDPERPTKTLDTTREFQLTLDTGQTLTSRDYLATLPEPPPGDSTLSSLEILLLPREPAHPKLRIHYEAIPNKHQLRKWIDVTGSRRVDSMAVESLDIDAPTTGGGFGLPLFVDGPWFIGLEYPAATNQLHDRDTLSCQHHPQKSTFRSKTAVIGTGQPDQPIDQAFINYIQENRPRRGPFLLFSSWYDRRSRDLTPHACIQLFDGLQKNLLKPYQLRLDTFLVDDGYQNPQSLWQPGTDWPEGFRPLADHLQKNGSNLGIWMPLNGLGLNPTHGKELGWTLAQWDDKLFYSLADPTYEKALRQVIDQHIEQSAITCLKHDFNFFHARTQTPSDFQIETNEESITDATIRLLDGTRARKPSIFLSLTSGAPLSPWWLFHADTLWMGHGDYKLDWSFPQSTHRQAEMTYRDEKLYRRLRIEKVLIPPSALMTHGIIRGKLDDTNPDTSVADWNDYVVMTLGRGTELQELYISPETMIDSTGQSAGWNELGSAIRWAQQHAQTLAHTVMIGGHPGNGEAYGYAHWSTNLGIFVLRNPSIAPKEFLLNTAQRPHHLADPPTWQPVIVYPYRERRPDVKTDQGISIDLPGQSVTVVHFYTELPESVRSVPTGRFHIDPIARSITIERHRPASLVPLMETIDEQTQWLGQFRLTGSDQPAELLLATLPAHGVDFQISSKQNHQQHRSTWGLDRHLGLTSQIQPQATILPTPLFPEEARATAVVRTYSSITKSHLLPIVGSIPDWPATTVTTDRFVIKDHLLFENRLFTRGRKLIERLGWWIGLVTAPSLFAWAITAPLVRRWHWAWAWLARLTAVCLVSVIYLSAPVSQWLVHLLIEEM
jgi:hypothetical protein